MANVKFVRKSLEPYLKIYTLIRDCILGPAKVKEKGEVYLPKPDPTNLDDANTARYLAYVVRAVFYNVTARTLAGYIGQIFVRDLTYKIPTQLDAVFEDADGEGVSLIQSAKRSVGYNLAYGRGGLFTDFPTTSGVSTKSEMKAGNIQPTIQNYAPWNIPNWRTKKVGSKTVLSLVVLIEDYVTDDDGFESKESIQYRVLRLGKSIENEDEGLNEDEDVYTVEIWRALAEGGGFGIAESYQPKDSAGKVWKEIPFTFFGSENNDSEIDQPPLYDLASLNIAHYRNSADYEESSFIVGQPTPVLSGLTEEWVDKVLKGVVQLGSRGSIPLPVGASADLLQAEPNIMPFEAMQHKERQMVALGAKLAEQKTVQRTATEADIEATSEGSILSTSADNVSSAYVKALIWAAMFQGAPVEGIEFELNTDFDIATLDASERAQLLAEWQGRLITFEEARIGLTKAGVATIETEVARATIEKEQPSEPAPKPAPPETVK